MGRSVKGMSNNQLQFTPDYTPEQLKAMGVYGEVYGPKSAPRLASLPQWPEHWYNEADPHGWLQWYNRYSKGRRIEDDDRQIKRWKAFKARHGGKAFQENPTPRRAFALRNWGVDPVQLLKDRNKKKELAEAMEQYKNKKYKTAGEINYIELLKKYAAEKPGLWANIRAKRARGGKPAKPGEEGYPDKKQWKRLTSKKAELLKEAITFGATKALIKTLRGQGTKIYRNVDDLTKATMADGSSKALSPNLKAEDFKNLMSGVGPSYMPHINSIYLPKGNFNVPGQINAPKVITPRQSFFHEGGHAMHYMEDSGLFPLIAKRARTGNVMNENTLAGERIANNNAINFMKQHKVPTDYVESYAKNSATGYGTYLDAYRNLQNQKINPLIANLIKTPKTPFSEIPQVPFSVKY